jgi:putative Mn2+ efflux pump MntP
MVLSVLALDAVAVALYYGAGLNDAGSGARNAFTIAWTIATLAVVGLGLGRIRRERRK